MQHEGVHLNINFNMLMRLFDMVTLLSFEQCVFYEKISRILCLFCLFLSLYNLWENYEIIRKVEIQFSSDKAIKLAMKIIHP